MAGVAVVVSRRCRGQGGSAQGCRDGGQHRGVQGQCVVLSTVVRNTELVTDTTRASEDNDSDCPLDKTHLSVSSRP